MRQLIINTCIFILGHFAIQRNSHWSVKWCVWFCFSHLCFCFIHLHFYRIQSIRSKCCVASGWVISNVWEWGWRQIRTEKYNFTKAALKTKQHIAHKILITLKVTAPWDLKIFQMKSTRLIFFWTKFKKENVHRIKSNLQNNVSRVGPALWPLSWGCYTITYQGGVCCSSLHLLLFVFFLCKRLWWWLEGQSG